MINYYIYGWLLLSYSLGFAAFLGLTGSVVLRSGQLSSLIAQLQELLKGVYEVEISSGGYDATLLAAQVLFKIYEQ